MSSVRETERVVVVGAGVGGLAAAVELAHSGCEVLVLERAAAPGGKVRVVEVAGRTLDAGPTVLTMRWVFDELFDRAGGSFASALALPRLPTIARHAWQRGGEPFDLHDDDQAAVDAVGRFAGAVQARAYRAFCERSAQIYRTLERTFLRASRPGPLSLMQRVGLSGLPALARIAPFATLWDALGEYFPDARLRQLFARYATYCGSSPFLAPATLMLIAHVERDGVWSVAGGMHALARALSQLAERQGVELRCDAHVDSLDVRDGRVRGVRLAGGESIAARAVVFNGDVAALSAGALGNEARGAIAGDRAAPRRSLSALTWNATAETDGFALSRHNVFFGADYASEFDELFVHSRLPSQPTVYVCAQDRDGDGRLAAPGEERLLVLVNAPPAGDQRRPTAEEVESCEQRTFRHLQACGLTIRCRHEAMRRTTPSDFARLFPATGGALYGQASHGWRASFTRPASRSRIAGLYLAGGSTHPGPGVPMAALSGRLAAASLLEDRASTSRSRTVAMRGGTSMR